MAKKLAIELFGHLRTFEYTFPSFYEHVINTHKTRGWEIDIFIHTWTETNHSDITWSNPNGEKRGSKVDDEILEKMNSFYHPKKHLIEEQLKPEDYMLTCKIGGSKKEYKVMVNASYTMYKAAQIRKSYAKTNDIKYDYVIVTRPDLYFNTPFCIDDYLEMYARLGATIPKDAIFIAYWPFCRGKVEDNHLIIFSNCLYFGAPETIDKAASYYELIDSGEINAPKMDENFYYGEILYMDHWLKCGLEPMRIKYFAPQDFYILRSKEELLKHNTTQERNNTFGENIFSVRNINEKNTKWKIITILWIKIKFRKK